MCATWHSQAQLQQRRVGQRRFPCHSNLYFFLLPVLGFPVEKMGTLVGGQTRLNEGLKKAMVCKVPGQIIMNQRRGTTAGCVFIEMSLLDVGCLIHSFVAILITVLRLFTSAPRPAATVFPQRSLAQPHLKNDRLLQNFLRMTGNEARGRLM